MNTFVVDYSLLPEDSKAQINVNGRIYTNGKALSLEQKAQVASTYEKFRKEALEKGAVRPSITAIAKQSKVSRAVVLKIEQELAQYGQVQAPRNREPKTKGICSTLTDQDIAALLGLLERNPFRTRRSYCNRLREITGTIVSESTISRFFLKGFPIRGGMRKPDLVPRDKFKPENIVRYFEYVDFIKTIDPRRLKFGDEKLLKGAEVYCRKGRRNVLTGETPEFIVNSDFRNTYAITGFCGIDYKCPATYFDMHDGTNDATSFAEAVIGAIQAGFFRPNDIMILDNAAIHFGGENRGFEDWLWSRHGISVVYLPTRAPELNPQELIWRSLVMKLRSTRILTRSHLAADKASAILNNMTHRDTAAAFRECKYLK